jgi:uncharacterized membrane protein
MTFLISNSSSKTKTKFAFPTYLAISIWPVLMLAAFLRLFQLGAEGVWIDEMYSIEDAINLSSGNLDLRPLYYLVLRVWMLLGSSDIVLRSLSVLLDLGTIYLAYRLCQFTLGKSAALVSALLLACSPIFVNHAQEIRMYALISCLTLAGSWAFAYALEKPALKHIATWALFRLLAVFTSPLMLLLVFADCVLMTFCYWDKLKQLKKFIYGLIFIGAAWSPLVLPELIRGVFGFVQAHSEQYDASVDIGLTNTLSRLTQFTVFWPIDRNSMGTESWMPLSFYKIVTLILLLTLIVGLAKVRFNRKSRVLWIAAWAFIPFVAQYVACETVMDGTIWRPRYLLYLAPYLIMLMGLGFDRIRQWQPLAAIAIAAFYLVAVVGGLQFYYAQDYRPQWNEIAAIVESQEQPNDVIVNYTWMGHHNFPRYYQGDAELITLHLPRNFPEDERRAMVQSESQTLPRSQRLWLVCQSGCREQEEFGLITEAVVGNDPEEQFFQDFANLTAQKSSLGSIELRLLTQQD